MTYYEIRYQCARRNGAYAANVYGARKGTGQQELISHAMLPTYAKARNYARQMAEAAAERHNAPIVSSYHKAKKATDEWTDQCHAADRAKERSE